MLRSIIVFLTGALSGCQTARNNYFYQEKNLLKSGIYSTRGENEETDFELFKLEYEQISNDLARYEKQGFNAISIVTFLLTGAFGVGLKYDQPEIFIFIAIAGVVAIQMMVAINYAYRVREKYLRNLEVKSAFPIDFYSRHITYHFWNDSKITSILSPLNVFVSMGVIFIISLIGFSAYKSFLFLDDGNDNLKTLIFVASILILCTHCLASFMWSLYRLRA
ncbi:MAG: hypothetical protein GVY12_00575 [Bacteroidetes bacterium]|jgi:hypothetical protein|nr:hypothetical protein [Bacteroidota bacterium]